MKTTYSPPLLEANKRSDMLHQTTLFVHTGHMKQLKAIAESRGLRTAQLVRVAIAEYLRRNRKP
jgi:16S rRNA U516 pseudouridylate synthase RsuA-like enzyme